MLTDVELGLVTKARLIDYIESKPRLHRADFFENHPGQLLYCQSLSLHAWRSFLSVHSSLLTLSVPWQSKSDHALSLKKHFEKKEEKNNEQSSENEDKSEIIKKLFQSNNELKNQLSHISEYLEKLTQEHKKVLDERDQAYTKAVLLEKQWQARDSSLKREHFAKDEALRALNLKLLKIESNMQSQSEETDALKKTHARILKGILAHELKTLDAVRRLTQLAEILKNLGIDLGQLDHQSQKDPSSRTLTHHVKVNPTTDHSFFHRISHSFKLKNNKKEQEQKTLNVDKQLLDDITRALVITSEIQTLLIASDLQNLTLKDREDFIQQHAITHTMTHTAQPSNHSEAAQPLSQSSENLKPVLKNTAHHPHRPVVTTPSKPKLKITALVITWDVGHNPLGRSYMLAEVLDRVVRNVVLMGFQFPRYGNDVWEPVRQGRIPVISLPGEDMPAFLDTLDRIAERMKPDIVIACKPRLPSVQLGILIKQKFGCPLIVDIDDHELSFFKNATEFTGDDLAQMPDGAASEQVEPYSELWTRLTQSMCAYADERIVSNIALHKEFGGTIVPHVRDEHTFDPERFDKMASRAQYGVPANAKVVLFFGTPRHHKGVDVLAETIGQLSDDAFRLVIVGSTTDRSVTSKLDRLAPGRLIYLPNQPFSAIPEIVMMADVICLPQDEGNAISQFQLPAKAIDAVAMGIPLLVARTPPLMQLVQDGVALPIDRKTLSEVLVQTVQKEASDHQWRSEIRKRFLERYSYHAAEKAMRTIIERALRRGPASLETLPALLAHERRVIGALPLEIQPRRPGIDIVVFWKQNDTGLYGRRSDMVIQYLASRPDVRRVIVFDAPISEFDLLNRRNSQDILTQERLVYLNTYEKVFGKSDTDKISYNVFVYPPGTYRYSEDGTQRPRLTDVYHAFIEKIFEREKVQPDRSVFWIYPKDFIAPELIDRFSPAQVVVDVVDDHRAWPHVKAEERQKLTDNYREILTRADMAFVNCQPMVEAMREFFPGVRLVPNGCDAHPQKVLPRHDPAFDDFMAWTGKTIGFVGNLEQKIDIALIIKIAQRFPECRIVLLGSTHANPQALQLKNYPNVRMPGVVPYTHIGAWISRFDVGIIPHLDLDMTRSMNPLKLYVYLSWRVPVVSTEIYNIDKKTQFVRVGRTHDAFLDHIADVIHNEKLDEEALQTYISQNSWSARFQSHVDELLTSIKKEAKDESF